MARLDNLGLASAIRQRATLTAWQALLATTVTIACAVFALSSYGLWDFGERVMQLPWFLPALVPFGLDALTVSSATAAYILRTARKPVRFYVWLVFLLTLAASTMAQWSHAHARGLSQDGQRGAAAAPIILALAVHVVIIVRRHRDSGGPTRPQRPQRAQKVAPVPGQALAVVQSATATQAQAYAEENGVSLRTAYRHLQQNEGR